eukprot:GGOE01026552.1.p5 GENE.GGOE01026552.1~~GGOE01026552.1.p5  ORF type:complete len:119 (-),score=3.24 GGOE01026552.1:1565-1921(-)
MAACERRDGCRTNISMQVAWRRDLRTTPEERRVLLRTLSGVPKVSHDGAHAVATTVGLLSAPFPAPAEALAWHRGAGGGGRKRETVCSEEGPWVLCAESRSGCSAKATIPLHQQHVHP